MLNQRREQIAISLIWLFHLSGLVGLMTSLNNWFIEKTPLNLLACFLILLYMARVTSWEKIWKIYVFFFGGILIEWIGVKYGVPFGSYRYGDNLGAKLDGIPYMMGINWAMLVLITGAIATKLFQKSWQRILCGAALMVFLDFFIEPLAPVFDFWYWENEVVPVQNYVAWFVIAALMHLVYQPTAKDIHYKTSLHLYLAQLTFFSVYNGYLLI
ncbi:MAG: carotenoid biosynthesis protein [Bacteroidota bacterium]